VDRKRCGSNVVMNMEVRLPVSAVVSEDVEMEEI
jgi:hypothetical protein